MFFDLEPRRVQPRLALGALGLRAGAGLSARAGSDREHAIDEVSVELARYCGLASLRGFSRDQREAWRRIAPILSLLDLAAWRDGERRALVDLIRAKGGRSERDFVAGYLKHPRLDTALQKVRARPA
jgi:hypothetical protein